ncbi:related to Protein dopey [Saccharomycodes ludwigii]|uniref:Related to Protein dopey n=1 Tax=Saccharomycodes ludwigii TaxID=36035 RepID=A0A376B9S7_9ASCO|nr:hypothetical protein SCDLUD_001747 [Saccharomycodes ludwigii]KAH3901961.1 hypothetical protein SCDLUD_001747 [Saccharomycodes ludwigii]SSD61329.1 related to Protein dopey [Saccharomycodes ludwigii]
MSLPLLPIVTDKNNTTSKNNLDHKEKQFRSSVEKALQQFDYVDDWADYISRLGKLLKALTSWTPKFANVRYYVPHPYHVARRLSSSLSPDLPSGVHSKTLEVYTIIFSKIGLDTLNQQCNIWVPGILPLMNYASISIKPQLIDLYENYLLNLSSSTLEILAKPMIASLLPGIDDESSEFQPMILNLLETLKTNLNNDNLFWQSFFLIMIQSKEHRLGGLVWLTKQMPSLNAVPHLVNKSIADGADNKAPIKVSSREAMEKYALSLLLPTAAPLVTLEAGLLIRCFTNCLHDDDGILIQRGILDLLLQRLHLDSPIFIYIASENDKSLMIMSLCELLLKKDMSLNRRIWSWFLKSNTATGVTNTVNTNDTGDVNAISPQQLYFETNGLNTLLQGLENLAENGNLIKALKITQSLMDRWEMGCLVTDKMFLKLMKCVIANRDDQKVVTCASQFFDNVDTFIIWGNVSKTLIFGQSSVSEFNNLRDTPTPDYLVLEFILENFHIDNDQEIIIRHLPLILLLLLHISPKNYKLCDSLVRIIPERAFLPIQHSKITKIPSIKEIVAQIVHYYGIGEQGEDANKTSSTTSDIFLPYSPEDLSKIIIMSIYDLLLEAFKTPDNNLNKISTIFVQLYAKIPELSSSDLVIDADILATKIMELKPSVETGAPFVFGIIDLFIHCLLSKLDKISISKNLRVIIKYLWTYLINQNRQLEAMNHLRTLIRNIDRQYLESSLSAVFIEEAQIYNRLTVLTCLWNLVDESSAMGVVSKPLELVLDELFDKQSSNYLPVSKWVVNVLSVSKSSNQLLEYLTTCLLSFQFINKKSFYQFDDIEIFTYYTQTLINVLTTDEVVGLNVLNTEATSQRCIELFGITKTLDLSTYKNIIVEIFLNFLDVKSNSNSKSVRTVLSFFKLVLNGTEYNFKNIVTKFLDLSSEYIMSSSSNMEEELITVSLLDILSNVLALSHSKNIELDIFDNSDAHLKYVDFLVTSISFINSPSIISSYVKLLTESILYFQKGVFNIILPLATAMIQGAKTLFDKEYFSKNEYSNYEQFACILDGIEELIQVSHSYLAAEENSNLLSIRSSDFLQNVVSNVFSSDKGTEDEAKKLLIRRQVVLQSFDTIVKYCYNIWNSTVDTTTLATKVDDDPFAESKYHQACKYKYKSRKLMENLFNLEPIEVLVCLIEENNNDSSIFKVVHALDGNRPMLTLPHLFKMIVFRCNPTSNYLDEHSKTIISSTNISFKLVNIIEFVLKYIATLEYSAIEDFYKEFLSFIKDVVNNSHFYDMISIKILQIIALVCEKIKHSKFGIDKKVRKEYSDLFNKYILSVETEPRIIKNRKTFEALKFVVQRMEYIVCDENSSDKFNATLSALIATYVTPFFKNPTELPSYIVEFLVVLAPYAAKIKSWKLLLTDLFMNNKMFFTFSRENSKCWQKIIFEWSQYSENKTKIIDELLVTVSTSSANPFNSWSKSEVGSKGRAYFKMCYLLLISPQDQYMLKFLDLVSEVERCCLSDNIEPIVKSMGFLLLRCIFLKFQPMHFLNSWSTITFILQSNFQKIYDQGVKNNDKDLQLFFQMCKTLDTLLVLNNEEFNSTQEWIFVIDTINCIYKTEPFVALMDTLAEKLDCDDKEKEDKINSNENSIEYNENKVPMLVGIHKIASFSDLNKFCSKISCATYKSLYGSIDKVEEEEIIQDSINDLFEYCDL